MTEYSFQTFAEFEEEIRKEVPESEASQAALIWLYYEGFEVKDAVAHIREPKKPISIY